MIASVAIKHKVNSDLLFDYRIPDSIKIKPLSIVEVDFAGKKTLAIVIKTKTCSRRRLKDITKVVSKGAVFTSGQVELAKKISAYFLTPFGPTLFSFFPNLSKREIGNIESDYFTKTIARAEKSELLIMGLDQSLQYFFQIIKPNSQNIILSPSVNKIEQISSQMKSIYPHLPIYTWHSKITTKQKRIIYQNCLCDKAMIVIGSRDALFLPFRSLKNIYIAKPSAYSYFEDQVPRYNAYYVVRLLKEISKCNLFVAESFPSIISYISYKKKLLSVNTSNAKLRFDLYDGFDREMQTPSMREKIRGILTNAKSILVIGPFKNKLRNICQECKSDLVCSRCKSPFFNDEHLCLSCNTPAPTACPSCTSRRVSLSGFMKNAITSTLPINKSNTNVTFSDLENLDDLPANFDNILVPYFDSMYEFGFVGYKNKLLEAVCSVSYASSNNVLIFTDKYKNELHRIESGKWENLIKVELRERVTEQLPPYTKAVKLVSKHSHEKSLELIKTISKKLNLKSPTFITDKKEKWTEALFLLAHDHFLKIKPELKKYVSAKIYFVVDPVDFGV